MSIGLRLKTFAEFSKVFYSKPKNFIAKQYKDVQKYGVSRDFPDVSHEILEKYTPFRRISKKKCSLSDSDYFIKRFEKEFAIEKPKQWTEMSVLDKVDFIVKHRYEKLVSNKIMNDITNSRVENSFILSTDGKIKFAGSYNSSTHCPMPSDLSKDSICLHNHPIQFVENGFWSYSDLPQVNKNSRPFSNPDLINCIWRGGKKSYVVDSKGIKFQFIPDYKNVKIMGKDFYLEGLQDDLSRIRDNAFDNSSNIEEALRKHYKGVIKRIKEDGHNFKILNFFDFDKF